MSSKRGSSSTTPFTMEELRKEYDYLNEEAFDSRLPKDLPIRFNNLLIRSAGRTLLIKHTIVVVVVVEEREKSSEEADKKETTEKREMISNSAEIRLNPKLINTQERLRLTLCHEMCHVAAWLLDKQWNDAHGPYFQKWREIAEARIPGITVETYHTYKVDFPVIYECTNPHCYGLWNRSSFFSFFSFFSLFFFRYLVV